MFNSGFATTKDQLIHEILIELYNAREHQLNIDAFLASRNLAFATEPLAKRFAELIIENMVREDLINTSGVNNLKQLSTKGKAIVESGGWLNHLIHMNKNAGG
jgi:hypothetical protein